MPTLEFKGKQHIYAHHLSVPYRPLIPDESKSATALTPPPYKCSKNNSDTHESHNTTAQDTDSNLIIHGDNLHALKALLPAYAGRIKCIYIDPPYNTGNEGWKYNDNVNSPLMREWINKITPVDGEDLERHDKWLCMMWPRLQLLRELLADDGAIFISIDDNEQHRLRAVMDEIFGSENFVTNIIWQKKNSPQNDAKYFSDNHDFVLCYARNLAGSVKWQRNLLPRNEKVNSRYKFNDNDGRGRWATDNLSVKSYTPEYDYPITNPKTGQIHDPPQGRCWITNRETMNQWLADNRVYFGKDGNGRPLLKRYLKDVQQGTVPLTIWSNDEVGSTNTARKAVLQIFHDQNNPFDNPKAVGLLDRIIRIATGPNDIVLDSFAGSGTTAHAVLQLNKEDGGNRKFILVECEDYADNITAERVRRVINGVPNARDASLREGLGGHFTYCTLGKPITMQGMLDGQNLPEYSSLASYLLHCATGMSVNPNSIAANSHSQNNDTGFFYESDHVRYHLLYEQDIEWLRDDKGALNYDRAKIISKYAEDADKSAVVFAPMRYMSQSDLTSMRITFCQLPYELTASRAQALEA